MEGFASLDCRTAACRLSPWSLRIIWRRQEACISGATRSTHVRRALSASFYDLMVTFAALLIQSAQERAKSQNFRTEYVIWGRSNTEFIYGEGGCFRMIPQGCEGSFGHEYVVYLSIEMSRTFFRNESANFLDQVGHLTMT